MGLLDNLFGNLDDPKNQMLLTMGLGLLSGSGKTNKNFGADVANAGLLGLQTYGTAQKAERENRASDLTQLSGAYNLLKQQEFAKMLAAKQAGQPYSPHPMLAPMEAKLAQLSGLGNLSGKFGLTPQQPAPQQAPQAPTLPAAQASQYSPAVRPELQASGPMPSPPKSAPDSSGIGGPAGGIPMEAWLAHDSTGGSYLKQLAEDNKPIVLRQGDLVGKGPNGNYQSLFQQPQVAPGILPQRNVQGQVTSAQEIPGYSGALSNIKGHETSAVEGAKFLGRVENMTTAAGAVIPKLLTDVVGNPYGAAGQSAPPRAGAPAVAKLTVAEPSKSAADPWSSIPLRYQPQGLGQSTFDKSMSENHAKAAFDLSQKLGNNADLANQRKAINDQALDLVDKSTTGPLAVRIADVKNFLVSRVGIPESSFEETPSATIALNKDLINAAVQRAKQMYGSRMTQSEAMLQIQRAAPNADMTKSVIKFLLTSDNALAGYQVQQANDFGRYLQMGGDPMRFEAWHARAFPATAALSPVKLDAGSQPQKPQSSQPTLQDIEAEILRRRGKR